MKGQVPDCWQNAPCKSGMLAVGGGHSVHWRAYGAFSSRPVLFIHGGPGSGVDLSHLVFFHPERHLVVLFDQRGTGQSTPTGCIDNNTTTCLVSDIERLRESLGIASWLVFGGSWGATLALIYAQLHPEVCQRLVLRGVSNSHEFQNRWILTIRPLQLPDPHRAFLQSLSAQERLNPVQAHMSNILSENPARQQSAVRAVSALESGLSDGTPRPCAELPAVTGREEDTDQEAYTRAKIYLHYWVNHKFLDEFGCLPNPLVLRNCPIVFIHGKSDWICPLAGAEKLAGVLTHAQLIDIPGAGHSPFHKQMKAALIRAVD